MSGHPPGRTHLFPHILSAFPVLLLRLSLELRARDGCGTLLNCSLNCHFLILLNEVSIPDKYIKSVLFLEDLGKEIIFSKSGMCLLD